MLQCCDACDTGPLGVAGEEIEEEHIDSIVRVDCRCDNCGRGAALRFRIDSRWAKPTEAPVVNPTEEPSKLMDVSQWLTLYHSLLAKSNEAPDKIESRRVAYEAGLCIAEALKFYEPDNDLPPGSAFFSDHTREQARNHPAVFARQKLLSLQAKLPNLRARATSQRPESGRKWWKFWENPRAGADTETPDSV